MAKPKKTIDPRVTELLVQFGSELEMVPRFTGKHVTLRWLEEASRAIRGVPLPPTSVWRIFKGQAPSPDWLMIQQVLTLCDISGEEIAEVWHPKWKALMTNIHALGMANILPPARQQACLTCGAAMVDEDLHQTYHNEQDAQRRRRSLRSVLTG